MSNLFTGVTKDFQAANTQAALKSTLISDVIADCKYGAVAPRSTVSDQYMNSPVVQDYTFQSGAAITDLTATRDSYSIDQKKSAVFSYDKLNNLVIQDPNWMSTVEDDAGYQLARRIDQFQIQKCITGAYSTLTSVGTLTPSGLVDLVGNMRARISESRGNVRKRKWIALDPVRLNLIPAEYLQVATGAEVGMALMEGANGFTGKSFMGFDVYETNEYLYSVSLTMGTNPTAGQTLSLFGGSFVITFVASLTSTNTNEVLIGAGAADTQNNLEAFINGTSGAGSTYTDMTAENRSDFKNSQTAIANFSGNVAAITKYGRINASTNVTSATLGTETFTMVGGCYKASDLTILQEPLIEEVQHITSAGYASHAKDVLFTTIFGGGVWHRLSRELVAASSVTA